MNIIFQLFTSFILIFLVGCANQIDNTSPKIISATVYDGKGIPYGDSESSLDYSQLDAVSEDPTYGYSESNPIKVGGIITGPRKEIMYLNALRGPNGETIEYERIGSCCPFQTPNGFKGGGLLDVFEINYEGLENPILLYINMYDAGSKLVPKGFTARESQAESLNSVSMPFTDTFM